MTFFTFINVTVKVAWKRDEESQLSNTVLSNSPFIFQMQNLTCRILIFCDSLTIYDSHLKGNFYEIVTLASFL